MEHLGILVDSFREFSIKISHKQETAAYKQKRSCALFYPIKSNNDDGGMLKCLDLQIM